MGLFDLVEQHHAVGPAAHLLGELARLVMAHIARRGADEPADGVLFHILAHVDADERVGGVEQLVCQLAHQFGLAHAGGAHKDEAGGPPPAGKAGPGALHGAGHRLHGLVLADDALFQLAFQIEELCELALLHLHGGDAGPQLHHLGHVLHLHLDAARLQLKLGQLFPQLGHLGLELGQALVVRAVLRLLLGQFFRLQRGQRLLGLGQFADLGVAQVAAGAGLVQKVDGLVRQKAVGDVPLGEVHRRRHDLGGDLHAVVGLVILLDAVQHIDGVGDAGLAHLHGLEAALQRLVLLDELAVLGEGGGADDLNFPAGQRGLQDVARVHRPLAVARAGDAVDLVDEQNDIAQPFDLVDEALDPLLELAAELGAGHQGGEVQPVELFALEAGGHLAPSDALGNALGDGGLAHAGLADEAGVVLLAAGQDLDGAVNFLVAAHDLVQLAGGGPGGEVLAVFIQEFQLAGALFLLLFLVAPGAEAEGEGGGAAGGELLVRVVFLAVALFLAHGGKGEHAGHAVLPRFLHEAVHALLHGLQVLVAHAELFHQIVHRLDAQRPGAGQAVALLLGLAVLHALDEHHGGAFFAFDTKHRSLSLSAFFQGLESRGRRPLNKTD